MIQEAGWGYWVMFAMAMMFMGQMMRASSRGRAGYTGIAGERQGRKGRLKGDDVARLEAAIGERDEVIEDLQRRLSEMEARLDFAERMIAK